jgi:hypothetical protein
MHVHGCTHPHLPLKTAVVVANITSFGLPPI